MAAVGLGFPAGAMAATEQITTAGVTKAQGFKLSLNVKQGAPTGYGGRYPNSVAGNLRKTNGHATQSNVYAFNSFGGQTLKFQGSGDLSYAKISGTFAKGRGSINMTFHANPGSKKYHVNLPKGCTGTGGYRRLGTLKGSYKLHADKLGTITQTSFKATLSTTNFQCNKATHGFDVQTFGGSPYVDVHKNKSGSVSELIEKSSSGSGWAIDHAYSVKGEPSADYSVGAGLKSATVIGAGGISGTAKYKASSGVNPTVGRLSGSFAVTMAAIGKVTAVSPKSSRSAKQSHT